jgi:uncharacterized membrane protein YphA (DoxX/SURF4 family)
VVEDCGLVVRRPHFLLPELAVARASASAHRRTFKGRLVGRWRSDRIAEGPERWYRGGRGVRLARSLYGVALPFFGLHHFVDLAGAAEAVPAWLPFGLGWAFLTGVGHVAAGIAILLGIVPRLAARLEAAMVTAFVVLVHVTGVIAAPRDSLQWTMLVVASAIGAAGWVVARSYTLEGGTRS